MLEEFKESIPRKSNIIIFRAEESKKTEPKERKVEDITIVNELCKITGTNKQTIKNVTRILPTGLSVSRPGHFHMWRRSLCFPRSKL
jgi:hypothetical protein